MRLKDMKPQLIRKAQSMYRLLMSDRLPIYVLGTNETARTLTDVLSSMGRAPEAFVDDYDRSVECCGRPIIKSAEIPTTAIVISCSIAINPVTAVRRLKAAGVEHVVDYFTLYILGNGLFPPPKFCRDNVADIEANYVQYEWVEARLSDETSRRTLERLLQFRYNFDVAAMEEFQSRLEAQYFEPFVPMQGQEVFVDGGGFDGKTTETFIKKCPSYRQVHYFEPDPLLMAASRKRLRSFDRISYHEVALSDREGEVYFDQTGTGSGAIRERGNLRVQTCALDNVLPQPPTFIKFDIEGAEFAAISGASDIIAAHYPALAVCVYHRQSDFWRVPVKVLSLYSKYKVFLRHYTEGIEETVMYFI